MAKLIIEIVGEDVSACLMDGSEVATDAEVSEALDDCTHSGDASEACAFVRNVIGVEFRTIVRNGTGEYENRQATDAEMAACARAIYFESETDFTDRDNAADYLIWQAAHDIADGE